MSYTPLFDTLTTGTLCGKWPDIGLWPVVLSLANRYGEIDTTPHFLASVTGLELEEVVACMERFCQPDEHSRTLEHEGRRLALIDPRRSWGWKVLNHAKYREKARLYARDQRRAAEAAQQRATSPDNSRSPPRTPENTPSNVNVNRNSEKKSEVAHAPSPPPSKPKARLASRIPEGWKPDPELVAYAEKELPNVDVEKLAEAFTDYWQAAAGAKARKLDWSATWRTWVRRSVDKYPIRRQGGLVAAERVIRRDVNGREIHG